jgi:hypothetical protein
MARFAIFGKNLTPDEIVAVKALVNAAAECPTDVEVLAVVGPSDPDAENDVIVVLGTPGVCADPELEADFVKAANGSRRAIWVWPEGSEAIAVPPAAEKYCYSYVPWNPEKLRAAAADDDVTCFETAAGTPVAKVPTERNLCVEADPKEIKPK